MHNKYNKIIDLLGKHKALLNESLDKYSSFRLGGPADLFYKANTTDEFVKAIVVARNLNIPFFIIGGGTNLLIGDKGIRGLVIKNETSGIKLVGIKGRRSFDDKKQAMKTVYIEADSGVGINRLVRFTLEQGFSGFEPFLGQPGSVGGALYINAHNLRMDRFIGDIFFAGKILKFTNETAEVPKSYFKFGYDQSIIQKTGDIILSAIFKLEAGDKSSLWKKAQEVLNYRRKTQPSGVYSSGCTFRNIKKSEAIRIATPEYTCSTGFILESVGLKNYSIGGARFSSHHANFIVHEGNATASNVLELIQLAKKKVKDKYGISLHEEIMIIGEF